MDRVTWFGLEVILVAISQAQVSWLGVEVVRSVQDAAPSLARVSWFGVEVVRTFEAETGEQESTVSILW